MHFNGGSSSSPQSKIRNFFNNRKGLANAEQPQEVVFEDEFTKCGMVNLMNNCYLNSIIQVVSNIPEIKEYVLRVKEDVLFGRSASKEERVSKEFLKIAKVLHDSFENGHNNSNFNKIASNKEVTPAFFIQSMAAIDSQFDSNEQCDAQEFFLCLINALIDGVKAMLGTGLPPVSLPKSNHNKTKNIFQAVFQGSVASSICCVNCGKSTSVDEMFYDISLPLPENNICLKLVIQNMYDYENNMPTIVDIKIRLFHESKVASLLQTIAPLMKERDIDMSNVRILTQSNIESRVNNEGISTVANKDTLLVDCINFDHLFIMAIDFGGLAKNSDFFYAVDHYFLNETDHENYSITKEFLTLKQPNTLMLSNLNNLSNFTGTKSQNALVKENIKENITGMFNKLSTIVKSSLKKGRYEPTDEQRLMDFFNKHCKLMYAPLVLKISKSIVNSAENATKDTCIIDMIKRSLPQLVHLKKRMNFNLFNHLLNDNESEIHYRVVLFMNNKTRFIVNSNVPFSCFPGISAIKVIYYAKPNNFDAIQLLSTSILTNPFDENLSVSSEKMSKLSVTSPNVTPRKKVSIDNRLDESHYLNQMNSDNLLIDFNNGVVNTKNNKGYQVNLLDILRQHFNEKTQLDDRECPECKQKSTSEMSYSLKTLPKVFVCHLKKFEYFNNGQKLELKMDLPPTINVCEFILKENQTEETCNYKIFGMVCHRGTYANGHYVSVIRDHQKQKWKCYDDERMSYVEDTSNLITLSPYLIFYIRD